MRGPRPPLRHGAQSTESRLGLGECVMGIPRKGSRKTTVNGKDYRYMIRPEGSVEYENHWGESLSKPKYTRITVQEDVEAPGAVLQWQWPYGAQVGPADVKSAVEIALGRGWD